MLEILKILENGQMGIQNEISENKIEYINSLNYELPDGKQRELLFLLLKDEDMGVRSALLDYFLNTKNPEVCENVVPFVSDKNLSTKNFAGEILLRKGAESVNPMLEYLEDCNADDKKFIIDLLGLIPDDSSVPYIMKFLNDENENVVLSCIEALGNLKSVNSLPVLYSMFEAEEVYKATIIETLGKIGSRDALPFITSNYNEDDDLLRFAIIEAMGLIGDENTFFFLLSELNYANDILIWPILNSLYQLKSGFGFDIPFDERTKNLVLGIVNRSTPDQKIIAANILLDYNEREVISSLLSIIGIDDTVDQNITNKLFMNPEAALDAAAEYFQEKRENIKNVFSAYLTILRDCGVEYSSMATPFQVRNIGNSLSRFMNDADEELRISAHEILFHLDPNMAILFFEDHVEDPSFWNRMKLAEMLGNYNNEKAISLLKLFSNDTEEMVRDRAAYFLQKFYQDPEQTT